MTIIAPGYNVEGNPAAGFVKNDGAGNFSFGEAGGSGGVGTGWELIEVKDISVDATTVTFSGLNGDADGEYMMLFRLRNSQALEVFFTIEPNGISANQNTIRRIHVSSGATSTSTFPSLMISSAGTVTDKQWIGIVYFDAKTGTTARQIISESNTRLTGLTIAAGGLRRGVFAGSWDDTTTNITSLDIVADIANGIGAGSQLCLYKKSSANGGGGGLQLIETIDVTVPTTSISFAGLDGNTDKYYKLIWRIRKDTAPASPLVVVDMRPNGVTTNQQTAQGFHSCSTGHGSVCLFSLRLAQSGGVTDPGETFGETLIDAEARGGSSLGRFFQTQSSQSFPTFGGPPSLNTVTRAGVWNENSTNLTSLDITGSAANAIGPGSKFSLYRVKN